MAEESPYWFGFRPMRFRMSLLRWHYLPRHPAYRYEYMDGKAWITPRPRSVDSVLDFANWRGPRPLSESSRPSRETIRIRLMTDDDWVPLTDAFYSAFKAEEPFKSLSRRRAKLMAQRCLDYTRRGGDEPLIREACFIAQSASPDSHDAIVGAALVTDARPTELLELLSGRYPTIKSAAHLTWLFVERGLSRQGVGTYLLEHVVRALRERGDCCLASTTMIGSDASLLWHWKNGFTLLDRGFSVRVGLVADQCVPESSGEENLRP